MPAIAADLAALITSTATSADPLDADETTAQRWLAVQALPSACASPKQLRTSSVQALIAAAVAAGTGAKLVLLGQCWRTVAGCVASMPAAQLRTLDNDALRCAAAYPTSAAVVAGVAAYVTARGAGALPDAMQVGNAHQCVETYRSSTMIWSQLFLVDIQDPACHTDAVACAANQPGLSRRVVARGGA